MRLLGPETYQLKCDSKKFSVTCRKGTPRFSGIANRRLPKLYLISANGQLIYVGITRERMRTRLNMGFRAEGKNGYHGYAWRHDSESVELHIWCHDDASARDSDRDVETIEAEIVFLARLQGQWPSGQTEIHFHESATEHREIAETIWRSLGPSTSKK